MVDVSGLTVKVGDEAVIIGSQGKNILTAEYLAEKISTINYEIVTRLSSFIPRKLI